MNTLKHIVLLFIFLIINCCFMLPANAIKIGLADNAQMVIVAVSSAGSIYDATGKELYRLSPMKSYTLKNGKGSILIRLNGKDYTLNSRSILIRTYNSDGFVMAKRRWYRGVLKLYKNSGGMTVVNDLNLEYYLLGVVPSEMPSKWNIEAHKAQAIAARSYAIANLGKRASRGYDLKDTPEDQAYGGATSETARTNQAVLSTRGQVLVYNNKVISAYYHASAGGHTTNSGSIWCRDLPYLRAVPSFDGNMRKNGHGIGMSQHGANNLANYGYNAYQILGYFYSNVRLMTVND